MARIRTIKPEFWYDEALGTIHYGARLTFIGILNLADDYGICKANVTWIKAQLFPYDANLRINEVSQWIDQLVKARMLVPFVIEDESYLYIRTFNIHQKIDKPSKNGSIPAEKVARVLGLANTPGTFTEYSASVPRLLAVGREGKGEEIVKEIISPDGVVGSDDPPPAQTDGYNKIEKTKKNIFNFIKDQKPTDVQPYVDLWNFFAEERKMPKVSKINATRKKKFALRIKDPAFNIIEILKKAAKSDFIAANNWFTFDWLLENETNFLKVIEGKFDQKTNPVLNEPRKTASDLQEESDKRILQA